MTGTKKYRQIGTVCFCIVLAVVCILWSVLPYLHACDDTDCLLCMLGHSFEQLWQTAAAAAVAFYTFLFLLKNASARRGSYSRTLVMLKVKLSD